MVSETKNHPLQDELDIVGFLRVIWKRRFFVLVFVVIGGITGAVYAMMAKELFRAEALLAPSAEETNGVGGMASAFGGLASLAGISLGGGSGVDESLAVLRSREFILKFIEANGVAAAISDEDKSSWKLHRDFISLLSARSDQTTGLVTVSIQWTDPAQAAEWVNKLVASLNVYMREKAIRRSNNNLKYLRDELQRTRVEEMRIALYELISQEQKKAMVANTQQEFTFRVLDKAIAPDERESPKRKQIVVLSILLGLLLGLFGVFVRETIERMSSDNKLS